MNSEDMIPFMIACCISSDNNIEIDQIKSNLRRLKNMMELKDIKSNEQYLKSCKDGIEILERDLKEMEKDL